MATFEQRFLDKLLQLAGGPGVPVSNSELRNALGWQADTYDREKSKLLKAKLIFRAKGQGGSVLVPPIAPTKQPVSSEDPINAFISYSHNDQSIKDQLVKHLGPLRRLGLINSWHDGELNQEMRGTGRFRETWIEQKSSFFLFQSTS